jgi:hypothetical protein
MPKKGFTGFRPGHTKGSTTDKMFYALTGAIDASAAQSVRLSLEVWALTGPATVEVGYQVSDDGETWPSVTSGTTISGVSRNTDGTTYGATFTDISAGLTAKYVRFGVRAFNDSGSTIHHFEASIRLEKKE